MTTHRSWFPFILVGLSTALLALIVVVYDPSTMPTTNTAPVVTAPTASEYEASVNTVLSTFALSPSADAAQTALDALIAMRVPTVDYQQAHLDLVIAFGQLAAGNTAVGDARLVVAESLYPWLTP